MATDPLSDAVSEQYERWIYPKPIEDLPRWLQSNWQWFDPSHAHRTLWPDRDARKDLDILIAGCGTNQAAVIAYNNPKARIVALDVSDASLNHHRHLAAKYHLSNLELHRLPIEQIGTLERDFDLIITTGVLHHLADPASGMRALAECMRPDAVLAVMLYATYGRIGVEMMQSVFRDLGLQQDEASVHLVRSAISSLGQDHPVMSYLGIAPDLDDDAGLVDTFLHGRERSYTIPECQALVAESGLVFQDLFLRAPYYPPRGTDNEFIKAIEALPRELQWSVMERSNPRNACHFFMACRPERPIDSYRVDFDAPTVMSFVPSFRYRCSLEGNQVVRNNWVLPLDPVDVAILQQVDGFRSISEIVPAVSKRPLPDQATGLDLAERARNIMQTLWQLDFIAIGLPVE